MPSDAPEKTPLDMIDALIGAPAPAAKERRPRGRTVLLAHALAQRENRLAAEKRAAASRLAAAEPKVPAAEPAAARQPAPERPGLDAVIVKALGASARSHVRNGTLDRESALADLIARTQSRLATAPQARPAPAPAPAPKGDREAVIAAAIRTHRERQQVFGELSLRQRATLRATAEAMVAKAGR